MTDEQLNQDDAVDDFFVLDTSGIEAVEKEETEEVEEIRIISPAPVQCLQAEGRTDSQRALKTRRKEETFDLTKILTNDAAIASPSQEKKERSSLTILQKIYRKEFLNSWEIKYLINFPRSAPSFFLPCDPFFSRMVR